MIRSVRAEVYRLMQPGWLLGGTGTMSALVGLFTLLVFVNVPAAPQPDGPPFPPLDAFGAADGLAAGFTFGQQMIALITLVVFAANVAGEFSRGTVKMLLVAEPRRTNLLLGKTAALTVWTVASSLVAFLVQGVVGAATLTARGVDVSAWWSLDAVVASAEVFANITVGAVGWGLIGFFLGVLTRRTAAAIGIGLGLVLIAENLVDALWPEVGRWLPGHVFQAVASGGSAAEPYWVAAAAAAAYAVGLLVVSLALFHRSDVQA